MNIKILTPAQQALKDKILQKRFSTFGTLKVIGIEVLEIEASGHPICTPSVGWCWVGNYVSGPPALCGNGSTTYTWCAS